MVPCVYVECSISEIMKLISWNHFVSLDPGHPKRWAKQDYVSVMDNDIESLERLSKFLKFPKPGKREGPKTMVKIFVTGGSQCSPSFCIIYGKEHVSHLRAIPFNILPYSKSIWLHGFSAHVFLPKNSPTAQLERPPDLSGSWPACTHPFRKL